MFKNGVHNLFVIDFALLSIYVAICMRRSSCWCGRIYLFVRYVCGQASGSVVRLAEATLPVVGSIRGIPAEVFDLRRYQEERAL